MLVRSCLIIVLCSICPVVCLSIYHCWREDRADLNSTRAVAFLTADSIKGLYNLVPLMVIAYTILRPVALSATFSLPPYPCAARESLYEGGITGHPHRPLEDGRGETWQYWG